MSKETKKHEHRFDRSWRGRRRCKTCRAVELLVAPGEWRPSMSLTQFANNWLPAVSGTRPEKMLVVEVAFPFEWNSYESWDVVFRARFDFTDVLGRTSAGMGTRVDVMNGWRSGWHEDFCRIDHEAKAYYKDRTGRDYDIGDNTYGAMREFIQSPIAAPQPASLTVVDPS